MKKTCIFIFSGTGMTKYVVDKIRYEMENMNVHVDVFHIENCRAQNFPYEQYDGIGFAYPVHSFNAPEIVVKFARMLPPADGMKTFIVNTAGADSFLNTASSALLIKTLEKKGFSVFYNKQFIMPSNFIVKDSEDKVNEKLAVVSVEIPKVTHEIINYINSKIVIKNALANIIAFLGRAEWYGVKCARFFYADANCDNCGICAKKCPNRNIMAGNNHVIFYRKCGLCMRCVYLCPRRAIKPRRLFGFIGFDSWYENSELSINR